MTEHELVSAHELQPWSGAHATWHGPSSARAAIDHILAPAGLAAHTEWAKLASSWDGVQPRLDHLPVIVA
eukprot:357789-Lingulodinium_polyedra.AAC.1